MHFTLLISALAASVLASPLATTPVTKTGKSDTWEPAPGTQTWCDPLDDHQFHINFTRSDPMETVINNACVAMMPECAFRDELPNGNICTATVDYQIYSDRSYRPPNVEATRYKDTQFHTSPVTFYVALPRDRLDVPVFWKVQDCYGYFHQLLAKKRPEGCHDGESSVRGVLTVGEKSSLAGTRFSVVMDPTPEFWAEFWAELLD